MSTPAHPQQGKDVQRIITDAAVKAVGENLDWNVRAYGKAWTGEGEDTEFIVSDVAKEVVNALYDHGLYIAARTGQESSPDFVGGRCPRCHGTPGQGHSSTCATASSRKSPRPDEGS